MSHVTLHQYFPAYGLQGYMRLAGVPHTVINSQYPTYESVGTLPAVFDETGLTGAHLSRCLAFLQARGRPEGDSLLNESDAAIMLSCLEAVTGTLEDVLLWCRTFYAGENQVNAQTMYGLRWLINTRESTKNKNYLSHKGMGEDAALWVEEAARRLYRSLGKLYASRPGPYFSGDVPCTLDAMLYGHLAEMRTTHPGSTWAAKYALPELATFFSRFYEDVFASPRARYVGIGWPHKTVGANAFDAREDAVNKLVAALPAVQSPPSQPIIPSASATAATAAASDSSSSNRTTVHGRQLTGMESVDVANRRKTFETPTKALSSEFEAATEGQSAEEGAQPRQSTASAQYLGFGMTRDLHTVHGLIAPKTVELLATVGIVTVGVLILRASISK